MVYHKLWVDYSAANVVSGAKLTLDVGNASLLLAGLTTLVVLAGGAFWKITAYIVFRLAVREHKTDGLGASIRFITANSGSALEDAWMLLRLGLKWRGHGKRPLWRCFRLLLLPVTIWVAFTGSSLAVSKLAAPGYLADVAPQDSTNCGLRSYYQKLDSPNLVAFTNDLQLETRAAQLWVQQCYEAPSDDVYCNSLSINPLPYTTSQVPCPWPEDRCVLGYAWQMDSGELDSFTHLGINAATSNRLGFRTVSTCSVINATEFSRTLPDKTTTNSEVIEYNFGTNPLLNNSNITYAYSTHAAIDGSGYGLWAAAGAFLNLVPSMNRNDGDLILSFFTANAVSYTEPNHDPLYLATGIYNNSENFIQSDHFVRVLACHQQYQYFNPNNGKSTPLRTIYIEDYTQDDIDLNLNIHQNATLTRLSESLLNSNTYNILNVGRDALLANSLVWDNISPGLPDYQWRLEVEYWFRTGLAMLAQSIIDFPTNSHLSNNKFAVITDPSPVAGLADQCNTQLVRSLGAHQTFSVIGIAIILFFSITFIIISLTLGCCVRKRGGRGAHAELGYRSLVMQRWALEGRGYKGWQPGTSGIPVRRGDEVDIPNPCLVDGTIRFPKKVAPKVEDGVENDDEDGIGRENVGFIWKN